MFICLTTLCIAQNLNFVLVKSILESKNHSKSQNRFFKHHQQHNTLEFNKTIRF